MYAQAPRLQGQEKTRICTLRHPALKDKRRHGMYAKAPRPQGQEETRNVQGRHDRGALGYPALVPRPCAPPTCPALARRKGRWGTQQVAAPTPLTVGWT